MLGIVRWFDENKGYGFILSTEEEGKEYFVHHSQIEGEGRKSLVENQKVEFEPTKDEKGRSQATNVRKRNIESKK